MPGQSGRALGERGGQNGGFARHRPPDWPGRTSRLKTDRLNHQQYCAKRERAIGNSFNIPHAIFLTPDHSGWRHVGIVAQARNFITDIRNCNCCNCEARHPSKKVGAQPISCLAKNPCKNRVDMAQMVTKIELCLDFSRGKGSAHLSVGL